MKFVIPENVMIIYIIHWRPGHRGLPNKRKSILRHCTSQKQQVASLSDANRRLLDASYLQTPVPRDSMLVPTE